MYEDMKLQQSTRRGGALYMTAIDTDTNSQRQAASLDS